MYPRACESVIMITVCPQSNMLQSNMNPHAMLCYVILTAVYNNMCYAMTCYIAAGCYVDCVLGYDNIYIYI